MKVRSILDKENTFQYTIPSLFGLAAGIMLKVVNTGKIKNDNISVEASFAEKSLLPVFYNSCFRIERSLNCANHKQRDTTTYTFC